MLLSFLWILTDTVVSLLFQLVAAAISVVAASAEGGGTANCSGGSGKSLVFQGL